ncbi:YbaB/EbfC family nucleoid-associated protein [Desulfothermus naphthae]
MNIQELMRQAQLLQKKILDAQEEIKNKVVEATAGGGIVKVVANGAQEIVSVEIDSSVVDPNDTTMLQDLIVAATNEALRKSKEMKEEEISKLTGGLKFPGLGMM